MTTVRGGSARRVDPRLQARRQSVERQEGLRRLWLVIGLTIIASLAIGAIAASRSTLLDIEAVEIIGAERADPRHIATAAGIEVGTPLIGVDRDEALRGVLTVPWVAEASLDRNWNGTVTIEVVERAPLLAFEAGTRYAMVDRTGKQLELVAEKPTSFLPVAGVEASGVPGQPVSDDGMAVVALVDQLTPGVAAVTEEVVVDEGALQVVLTTGGRANFGDERSLGAKFVALETLLAQVDLRCVEMIDVRVPSAPTIRRLPAGNENEEPLADAGGC